MRRREDLKKIMLLTLALIILACLPTWAGETWKQATGSRQWLFPADHGAHPEFKTEWWYFTGNLTDQEGKRYGYQLTFFRQGIRREATDPSNPWSLRDVYPAHFAITNVAAGTFTLRTVSAVQVRGWREQQRGKCRFGIFTG